MDLDLCFISYEYIEMISINHKNKILQNIIIFGPLGLLYFTLFNYLVSRMHIFVTFGNLLVTARAGF